jgi:hypothetical protein
VVLDLTESGYNKSVITQFVFIGMLYLVARY